MKLVLLQVVLIAVFEVNGRVYDIGPEKLENIQTNESKSQDMNVQDIAELRGKADKKLLKEILKELQDGINPELTSVKDIVGKNGHKLDSLEDSNTEQNSKLDWIIEHINHTTNEDKKCPDDGKTWLENNGNCFYFSTTTATWPDARKHCKSLGSTVDLAELGNPKNLVSDYWLMETISSTRERHHLGAWSPSSNNVWIWVHTGRALPLNFPLWGEVQPDNSGWCINTWPLGNKGRLYVNDIACNYRNKFVCQLF